MSKIKTNNYYSRRGPTGFKIPSTSEPYTFLTSLAVYGGLGTRIGNIASGNLSAVGENISKHHIDTGLSFLKAVAASQRAHEINFINERIQDLEVLGLNGSEIQNIKMTLEDIKSGNQIDYLKFIQSLNSVINNLQRYQQRLQAFNNTAISNIPQTRMVEGLITTIGTYANFRDTFYYSQEEAVRQLTLKWLQTSGREFMAEQIANGIIGGKNVAAAIALVSQQLTRYIYDRRDMIERHVSVTDKKGKNADFKTPEEFAEFINNFDLDAFEASVNLSAALKDNQLLQEIQQMYGIDYDSKTKANGHRIRKSASKEVAEVKAMLGNEPLITKKFQDVMQHITVKWDGKKGGRNKLAFQSELLSALSSAFTSHTHLGGLNMGTDMLLGSIGIGINYEQDNGEISNGLKRIAQRLQNEVAVNDPQKTSKIYLEEMQNLNKALTGLRQGFIIHETTKNYNTLERGRWPNDMNSFSGREMNLQNYINSVSLMGIQGLNTKSFALVANNLATDAIGASLKEPLEHLLAIFAGIIMFDDFAVIGKEVTQGLQTSNVSAIHLYKLQEVYFPASMFLDATYQAMTKLQDELLKGNGFTVNISVPTINYYTANGLPDYKYGAKFEQRWEGVRSYAETNTKIHLHFAAGFLTLMASLL